MLKTDYLNQVFLETLPFLSVPASWAAILFAWCCIKQQYDEAAETKSSHEVKRREGRHSFGVA